MNQPDHEVHNSVESLIHLLAILHPSSSHPQEILTVYQFTQRYRGIGLNAQAQEEIARSRRLVETRKSYHLNGLGEFNIGLIFLYWGHCGTAGTCFDKARQQWHLTNENASVCLTYFAEGCAHYHAQQYEAAMSKFGRAEQLFPRVHLPNPQTYSHFSQQLLTQLANWKNLLQELLLRPFAAEPPPPTQQAPFTNPEFDGETPTEEAWRKPNETGERQTNGFAQPFATFGEKQQQEAPLQLPDIGSLDPTRHSWYKLAKRDPGFLHFVPNGIWLLVTKLPLNHQFAKGQLVVVAKEGTVVAGTRLTPYGQNGEKRPFFLAEIPTAARFLTPSPNGFELQLSSHPIRTTIFPHEIMGLVIGFWRVAASVS